MERPREGSPGVFAVAADGATVRLIGELDLAAVPSATAALTPGAGELTVDCSGLTFLDAAGLEVLVRAHRACQRAGQGFVIVNPAPCVRWLLTITGLDQYFSIRSGPEEG